MKRHLTTSGDLTKYEDLSDELVGLVGSPSFGKFDIECDPSEIDFEAAFKTVQLRAPEWHCLLLSILPNERAHRTSYAAKMQLDNITRLMFTITSMVLHSKARTRSNFLCKVLDAFLLGNGVKREVVEVLAGLGLCDSYKPANELMMNALVYAKVGLTSSRHGLYVQRLLTML